MKMRTICITFFIATVGCFCIFLYRTSISSSQEHVGKYLYPIEKPNPEKSPEIAAPFESNKKGKDNAELMANQSQKTTDIISRLNSEHISASERKELGNQIDALNESRMRELEQELTEILQKFAQLELDQKAVLQKNGIEKQ